MKLFCMLIGCWSLLMVCGVGAFAQSVQTDYDHNFNLAKLKTYGFQSQTRQPDEALGGSPINDRRIHDALDAQLTANGLASSDQPDFQIAYFVTTRKGLNIQDNRFGIFQRMGSVNVNTVTEGTLVVVFIESTTQQEVWRGYASAEINPKDLNKDVNKAVAKLIQKFKKNQAGQK
jgi:predicted DNA-binding transcriptional regulator